MSGFSSKALAFGTPENKLKYNGKEEQKAEFSDGSGLDWLDYGARMYDAQVGRWNHIDPKCEILEFSSAYNYCFNSPIFLSDPDGRKPVWNNQYGKDSQFIDDETNEVVSWEDVQKYYRVGAYADSKSVLISQALEKDLNGNDIEGKVKNDWNTGVLSFILKAAKDLGGTINILYANDISDAADKIEKLPYMINNLFIASHGTTAPRDIAFFMIGDTFIQDTYISNDATCSQALDRISKKLIIGSNVVVFACGSGGLYNRGNQLLKNLAKKLNSTVYGPQSSGSIGVNMIKQDVSIQNRKSEHTGPANMVQGIWTKATIDGKTSSIKNVSFDAFGRPCYDE